MTTYLNTSYAVKNVNTAGSTIVTVGAGVNTAVTSIIIANTSVSPITASVYITRSAVNYYLVNGATIPVGGSLEVIQGNRVVLIPSDALVAVASASSSADCVVSVLNGS
jgi:hypothetical protein